MKTVSCATPGCLVRLIVRPTVRTRTRLCWLCRKKRVRRLEAERRDKAVRP